MKNIATFAAPFVIGTLLVSQALAAQATGTAVANVVSSLTIQETQGLSFGTIAASSTAGTVKTNGEVNGGVTRIATGKPGIFRLTGRSNAWLEITYPGHIELYNGSNRMVGQFIMHSEWLDANGIKDLILEATLNVGANQAPGLYTGTYTISANY